MTPTEALADALSDQKHAVIFEPDDFAAHIAAALDALGFTVARTQDAADGEALRLLREAMGPGRAIRLSGPWGGQFWDVSVESRATVATHAEASRVGLSQALDACRAAIEATR